MLYKNRSKFGQQDKKLGNFLKTLGITPNQWTVLSIVFALATLYFLAYRSFLVAALTFAIAAVFDSFDGAVARATGKSSKLGAYYDTITDRYVEFFVVLGLLIAALPSFLLPSVAWLFIYLFGSFMTTYSKAAAKEKDLSKNEIKGGILERAERLGLLFVGIVLAGFSDIYLTYIIVVLAVLSNITALQRIHIAIKGGQK